MSLATCSKLLLALCMAAPHPISVSSSRLEVDGRHVHVTLRCQATTLNEAVHVDRNADGKLDVDELDRARGAIESYLLERYVLTTDAGAATGGASSNSVSAVQQSRVGLEGHLTKLRPFEAIPGEAVRSGILPVEPMVDMELDFEGAAALANLRVDCALFREADPWHRDQAEIVWNGTERETRLLWIEDPRWSFTPSSILASRAAPKESVSTSTVLQFVRLGVEHILTGYDHIAFLIALIVASRRVRSLLAVVTAFTLAHSLSLACAATGLVEVSPRLVEPLIALSIAYVACRNMLDRADRRLWPEAFAFGLVHGLGFAGSIAETLAAEKQKLWALFGFNLGVELGQLAIVIVLVLALRLLTSFGSQRSSSIARGSDGATHILRRDRLAPRWVLLPTSALVAVLGVYWFVVRAWIV